jgi:uncharacterized phage protein (TIGR01671 family)
MREILFRGKRADNGAWETGSLVVIRGGLSDEQVFIADKMTGYHTPVIPETVGQFTGLTDKNGKKVFEGDILVFCKGATYPYQIEWDGMGWKLYRSDGKRIKEAFECNEIHYVNISEIIGNIHDNPELLEVAK